MTDGRINDHEGLGVLFEWDNVVTVGRLHTNHVKTTTGKVSSPRERLVPTTYRDTNTRVPPYSVVENKIDILFLCVCLLFGFCCHIGMYMWSYEPGFRRYKSISVVKER